MAIISFDDISADLLSYVLAGASSKGAESMLIVDCFSDGKAKVSSNTPFARTIELTYDIEEDESAETLSAAFYASALSGIAGKIDEGEHLSFNIKEGTIHIATGSTTITLENLYDSTPEITEVSTPDLLTTVNATEVIGALTTAAGLSPQGDGYVALTANSSECAVSVRSSVLHSQEIFPSTLTGDDSYHVRLDGKTISPLKTILGSESVDNMRIMEGQGAVSFNFDVDIPGVAVTQVKLTLPTIIDPIMEKDTPCDEDVREYARISKKDLAGSIKPLIPVIGKQGSVTLDTSESHGVKVSLSKNSNKATTVVLDAEVQLPETVEVSAAMLLTALKSISTPIVVFGTTTFKDKVWATLEPIHDDDEDTGDDIVIAIPTV